MAPSWNFMLRIWLEIPLLSLIESLIIRQSLKHFCYCGAPCMTSNKVMTCSGCVLEVYRASASAWKPTKLSLFCLTAKIMSISARMHFFPPFAGHASFRELSKLWQEVFFKLDLGWLAGALLSTLIKLPVLLLKIFQDPSNELNILAQAQSFSKCLEKTKTIWKTFHFLFKSHWSLLFNYELLMVFF